MFVVPLALPVELTGDAPAVSHEAGRLHHWTLLSSDLVHVTFHAEPAHVRLDFLSPREIVDLFNASQFP